MDYGDRLDLPYSMYSLSRRNTIHCELVSVYYSRGLLTFKEWCKAMFRFLLTILLPSHLQHYFDLLFLYRIVKLAQFLPIFSQSFLFKLLCHLLSCRIRQPSIALSMFMPLYLRVDDIHCSHILIHRQVPSTTFPLRRFRSPILFGNWLSFFTLSFVHMLLYKMAMQHVLRAHLWKHIYLLHLEGVYIYDYRHFTLISLEPAFYNQLCISFPLEYLLLAI